MPFFCFVLDDVDDFLGDDTTGEVGLAVRAESNLAGGNGEKRVIAADAHIFACLNLGAALTNDNHARTSC